MLEGEAVVVDTNILVHLMRGKKAGSYLEATYALTTRRPRPVLPIVVAGEIQSLAIQLRWGGEKVDRLHELLRSLPWADINSESVIDAYAILDSSAKARGKTIGKNDVWIAAVARVLNAFVLTTDRDFEPLVELGVRLEHIDESKLR